MYGFVEKAIKEYSFVRDYVFNQVSPSLPLPLSASPTLIICLSVSFVLMSVFPPFPPSLPSSLFIFLCLSVCLPPLGVSQLNFCFNPNFS